MITRLLITVLCCGMVAIGQTQCTNCDLAAQPLGIDRSARDTRTPDALMRADYEKAKHDVGELLTIAEALRVDLEQHDPLVMNVAMMKRLDQLEKLVKSIRAKLRRK